MKRFECIINKAPKLCPHENINGALCSACKLPDIYHAGKVPESNIKMVTTTKD